MDSLLTDLQTLAAIAASVVTTIGIVFGWFGKAWSFLASIFSRKKSQSASIPRSTLIVHPPISSNGFWWNLGTSGGNPAMHIGGDLQLTNTTNFKISVAGVKLKKPALRGYVLVQRADNRIYGGHAIPELTMQHAMFEFWAHCPFKEAGESFVADLSVVDQFGNDHWLRNVQFSFQS